MKPNEKRTNTQLGLGKVSGEARETTKRTRVDAVADTEPPSAPPISAPPPSGGAISGAPPVRQTRALESNRPRNTRSIESRPPDEAATVDRTPSPPPASVRSDRPSPRDERIDRVEIDRDSAQASVRGAPSSRKPIEVTQVDTRRIPRVVAPSKPSDGRFAAEEPTGRRPISGRGRADDRADVPAGTKPVGSRTVDGRPLGKRADGARPDSGRAGAGRAVSGPAVSGRATTGRPSRGRPASIRPPEGSASPAPVVRSARVSIREDNVGDAVMGDAIRTGGRSVPRLLKSKAEIAAAPIDHRAGFLLAHIDGVTTVQGLVDICGMSEDQVNEILDRLCRLGIVAIR